MNKFATFLDRLLWAKAQKEVRDDTTYNWSDVARAAVVSRTAVSIWRKGDNSIDAENARPLANWLGVNAVWLEDGSGSPLDAQNDKATPDLSEITEIISAYWKANKKGRNHILGAVRDITKVAAIRRGDASNEKTK